ncbi:MAG: formate dehydrogenase accessory sulfurtransferase FdhD [Candidatus Lokiarchaeota archaeon]|nr:formate dehydrogenase accessory sulfurtransferase FdhD [Candidatus Lokiarchaeota archaeon]MBD3342111.1 formate dehydrogenase accessory sulfurtransferase FdhD [Candidatus Lokiarchaeota archaeon]
MFKRKVSLTQIKKNQRKEVLDVVLIEKPVDIIIDSEPLVNIICLPKDLKELSVGFLYSIGIIDNFKEIKSVSIDELESKVNIQLKDPSTFDLDSLEINPVSRVVETTCGISSPWRNFIKKTLDSAKEHLKATTKVRIQKDAIFKSIIAMQKNTVLFRETGGCHGAAVFDLEGNMMSSKEDIGRHNAIDKVIGDMLIQEKSFKEVFLTSTGRLTGDSVLKAIRAKVPILASVSAAIESGIRLAYAYGITLVGFVRGSRMNIYSHPERISIH